MLSYAQASSIDIRFGPGYGLWVFGLSFLRVFWNLRPPARHSVYSRVKAKPPCGHSFIDISARYRVGQQKESTWRVVESGKRAVARSDRPLINSAELSSLTDWLTDWVPWYATICVRSWPTSNNQQLDDNCATSNDYQMLYAGVEQHNPQYCL